VATGVSTTNGSTITVARSSLWGLDAQRPITEAHDIRLPGIMLELLRGEGDLVVGDNAPYAITGNSDYTVPVHAEARGLPHVEIEIRQDLIAEESGQAAWAARLAGLLPIADARLREAGA
jgi:predicted N-formylglutamate amidohydrolase